MTGYPAYTDLAAYCGGVTDTTQFTNINNEAINFVEKYCGRVFVAQSATRKFPVKYHVSRRGQRLNFFCDCAEITTITNGDGVVVASTEYFTLLAGGRAFTNASLALVTLPIYGVELRAGAAKRFYDADGLTDISVAGYWGYAKTDPPAAIWNAILRIGKIIYNQRSGGGAAVAAAQNAGVFVEALDLPKDLRDTLNLFRRAA